MDTSANEESGVILRPPPQLFGAKEALREQFARMRCSNGFRTDVTVAAVKSTFRRALEVPE